MPKLDRYLTGDFLQSFLATLIVLLVVSLGGVLVDVLGNIADGGLPRRPDGKTHYVRVFASFAADGRVHVRSVGAQGSHQLAATSQANAIAVVPDGDGVAAGADVQTLLLSLGR